MRNGAFIKATKTGNELETLTDDTSYITVKYDIFYLFTVSITVKKFSQTGNETTGKLETKRPATWSQKPDLFRLYEVGDQAQSLPLLGKLNDTVEYPLYVRPLSARDGDIFTSAAAARHICEQDNVPKEIRHFEIQNSDVHDKVSEECGREERGLTEDEERQEEPASASSSSEEQFVPVVVENVVVVVVVQNTCYSAPSEE